MKFTSLFITLSSLILLGACSTQKASRSIASVESGEVITESTSAKFAIKENGIKIDESVTTDRRTYTGGRFELELDGVHLASVISVVGDYSEFKDGDDAITHKKGKLKGKVTVIRDNSLRTGEFSKWYQESSGPKAYRKSISVIFHNDAGEEKRVTFHDCFPTKYNSRWKAPELNSSSDKIVYESLEIAFDSYELK